MKTLPFKVNLLCVTGAALGIVSLFFPWIVGGNLPNDVMYRHLLVNDILLGPPIFSTLFIIFCSMFLVGTGLSFLTPAGGFVQMIGIVGFLYAYPSAYRDMAGTQQLSLGAYLGIMSVAIVIIGLCIPIGPGHRSTAGVLRKMVSTANRFLTFSPFEWPTRLRINLLCVIGAFLAFLAIALPWLTLGVSAGPGSAEYDLYWYTTETSAWKIGAWIFILSSAAAFVTPLAGFAQLIGAFWWWGSARSVLGTSVIGSHTWTTEIGLGFWLGVFAAAVVLASLFFPIGFGYLGRKGSMKARLFSWGKPAISRIS